MRHFATSSWPWVVFCVYLLVLPVYAGVYYGLFREDPRNFLFNSEIIRERQDRVREDVSNIVRKMGCLDTIINSLDNNQEIKRFRPFDHWKTFEFGVDCSLTLSTHISGSSVGVGDSELVVEVSVEREKWGFYHDRSVVESSKLAASKALERENTSLRRMSEALSNTRSPELWTYWDFLYFSGITLTTVGYGDILPNSTVVRMLVLSEALLGVFLLCVAINRAAVRKPS